jgi:epsilon-lactone hydrolase
VAYRWLLAQGVAPARISLCGDSAGGGLAVALMTLLRDKHLPLPAAAVAMSPWVDMEATGASFDSNAGSDPVTQRQTIMLMARTYLGRGGDPREPLASPIHANLARLPPLLVQAGSREVLLDDAKALVEAAQAQGVDARLSLWPGMPHTFQLFAGRLDEADDAIHEAAGFLAQSMTNDMRKQA